MMRWAAVLMLVPVAAAAAPVRPTLLSFEVQETFPHIDIVDDCSQAGFRASAPRVVRTSSVATLRDCLPGENAIDGPIHYVLNRASAPAPSQRRPRSR